ncbi:LytR/AlgR family response regulator transcription factor [Flavihumibacter petaseus]|uniref:Putative two-component response regulator n=1 Tax=Flavihumibacter petaseus NBRC 106054 TaxID=1220578 RepID=A0A0E9N6F6_9BACT|nr:LytTR family DNA-binding domain-containing protein [Flavihumibacter petaseus]GAO44925.1 putative two-component response regulator [Flavihumibacter petaseus NBRC 106054]
MEQLLSCLIVEDEPIARDIVAGYLQHHPQVRLAGSCANAIEARNFILKEKVDILLLDINMPVLDGLSFLRSLRQPPEIIFTTAYKEHAVAAFELEAVDYLLKPFSLERFLVAIDKAVSACRQTGTSIDKTQQKDEEKELFLRTDGKIFRIDLSCLIYAEANGNYTRLVESGQVLMPAMTFSALEAMLPAERFVRIHRSFLVNKAFIRQVEGNVVYAGKFELPIGSSYKEAFLRALGM